MKKKSPEIVLDFVNWIFVEGVLTETVGGFRQEDFQWESSWKNPPTEIKKKKKGKKPREMLKMWTEFILYFRRQNTEFSTDIKIEIAITTAACRILFWF